MPLLLLTTVLTGSLFLLLYVSLSLKEGAVKLDIEKFFQDTHTLTGRYITSKGYDPRVEEINNLLRRICQTGQSLIVRCQYCEVKTPGRCPYPTEEFCESAKGVDYNDPTLVWGFLPSRKGSLEDLFNSSPCAEDGTCFYDVRDIEKLKNVEELPAFLLSLAQHLLPRNSAKLVYRRPEGKAGDICAVEGVITGERR